MSRILHEQTLKNAICDLSKHRGEIWWDVLQRDEEYCRWVLRNEAADDLDEDVRDALDALVG